MEKCSKLHLPQKKWYTKKDFIFFFFFFLIQREKHKAKKTKNEKRKKYIFTISIDSGLEARPSSRARERARSLTLHTCASSWDASFPFIPISTNFSAFFTVSFFAISPLNLCAQSSIYSRHGVFNFQNFTHFFYKQNILINNLGWAL